MRRSRHSSTPPPTQTRADVAWRLRLRAGFGLVTTVMVVAIIATLGAVLVLNLRGIEEDRRLRETAADLVIIDGALTGVAQAASRYPLQLSHLATPPTTADQNSCGLAWQDGWTSNWQSKSPFGPFYRKRIMPIGTGFQLGIGHAMDTMVRVPATTTGAGTLRIRIPDVSENDAIELDVIIDAGDGRTAGKVQWTVPASGRVDTLNFIHTRAFDNC